MKKIILITALLTAVFTSVIAQMIPTSVKITVRNDLGALESGVKVSLYKNKEDYEKSVNPEFSGSTDAKGNVYFQNVTQLNYYVSAEKGDKNNFGAGEKLDALTANRVNKVTIIISE